MRLYNGKLAFADLHFDRLEAGAAAIGMSLGYTRDQLREKIQLVLDVNQCKTMYMCD